MQETDIKVEWDLDDYVLTSSTLLNNNELSYDYEVFGNEWSFADCVPTITKDKKLEELSCSTTLTIPLQEVKEVKLEASEPCTAALAIEANIPSPKASTLSKWRTFISSVYYHPNILVHHDVDCLHELFDLLGRHIDYGSANIMIDLGEDSKEYKPIFNLRPMLHPLLKPPKLTFALIKDFFIDNELKICIVKKYSILDSMKNAVREMVNFIVEFPEALYLEKYGFILDFLLKFGIPDDVVIDAVMRTQRRRRKCQEPASVLVLKKANKLGNKGRKEFLQKRLSSPRRKYDPVVPIVKEAPPVRQLRNRTTGGRGGDRTPAEATIENVVHSNLDTNNEKLPNSGVTKPNPGQVLTHSKIYAVKRKLFHDVSPNSNCQTEENVSASELLVPTGGRIGNSVLTTGSRAANLFFKPRKMYQRRDKSVIETPFTCTMCPDRSFAYKGNLVLHMKKKHSQEAANKIFRKRKPRGPDYVPPFSCPVCLVGYSTKYKCKVHIQQFHPEQKDWQPIPNVTSPDASPVKRTRSTRGVTHGVSSSHCHHDTELQISDKLPSTHEESSQTFPNNMNSGLCVHSFSSGQELNFDVSNDINVAFDGLQFETFNQVATRQQFQTAVK
ncbi:unnamed protein product [Orchesella dallaii]|uniref:C2H2-type domain-containing protein n=1 Tax=Orchesella dallaii TaxID=48710 RepID=A0ABP1PZ79_9HEXA